MFSLTVLSASVACAAAVPFASECSSTGIWFANVSLILWDGEWDGDLCAAYSEHLSQYCLDFTAPWTETRLDDAICARSDGRRGVRLRPTVAIYPNGGTAGSGPRIHLQVGMVVVREACLGAVQTEEWRFKPRDREHLWR